jgi:hypothetical protein
MEREASIPSGTDSAASDRRATDSDELGTESDNGTESELESAADALVVDDDLTDPDVVTSEGTGIDADEETDGRLEGMR